MTINAQIRISAIVDQAVKALREVKAEAAGVATAASPKGKPAFTDVSAGATEAAKRTKEARDEAQKLREQEKAAAREKRAEELANAKAASDAAKKAAAEQKAIANEAAKQLRQSRNQARQLAPQVTDIVVGLSTGQNPFTVLLQQGGQLKDLFGGVGGAFRALTSIFTVGRVVVGGVAAAFVAVAAAAAKGYDESAQLNKTLALTGNIADTSAGRLDAQARKIADLQKASIGAVRETLTGLVATGKFTSTSLDAAGRAAVALSKLNGKSAAETIEQFQGMSAGVATWAAKSNQAYNFLTAEQFKYIQSLEAQGRTQEAMRVTLDALAATMEQRSVPAIGTFERAWNAVKKATSDVLDNLKAIGRDETAESKLNSLQERLKRLQQLDKVSNRGLPADQQRKSAETLQVEEEIEAKKRLTAADQVRATERAIAAQNAQEEIKKSGKAFQDSLAQIDSAGAQKRLAQQLAALDLRQAGIERENANGLLSEADYSAKLNAIEQQRLAAQAATVKRQIEIERGKTVGTPAETNARNASVTALEGQLVEVQGRIAAAAIKARSDAEGISLNQSRDKAAEWEQIWQKAADQIRALSAQNGATAATQIANPIQRATAEAALKTADLTRQLDALKLALDLKLAVTVDPGQRAELLKQIEQLGVESKAALDEATRAATFASLQTQLTELSQALVQGEQRIAAAVENGTATTVDGEQKKFDARAEAIPQLETILRLMQALASTPGEKNAVATVTQDLVKLKDATTAFQKATKDSAVSSLSTALTDISTGAKNGKEALTDMVKSFATSMLDLINQRLAEKLVNQFIDAGSKLNSDGDGGGFWASLFKAFAGSGGTNSSSSGMDGSGWTGEHHGGGVVGASGGTRRRVPYAAFLGAPRYHTEGIVGLKPRERGIIALDGEEVLDEDNPRHIKNFSNSVNGVQISVSVTGAQGTEGDQRGAADQLTQRMRAVVVEWAAEESRQGGMFARGAR
ncbi:MAG: phage tail length tape measure family protein [Burkholderiaceae bacterium]